jgi:hypothetical protein
MPLRSISCPRIDRWLVLTLASIAAATLGCGSGGGSGGGGSGSELKSSGVAIADLDAFFSISADEPGQVRIFTVLEREVGFENHPVALNNGDSLDATGPDGHTRRIKRSLVFEEPHYIAEFETHPAEGMVEIGFRGTTVGVPLRPEFTVTAPTPGTVLGFQEDLEIEWTPAEPGKVIRIRMHRTCHKLAGGTVGTSTIVLAAPDTGEFSYDMSQFSEATDPAIDTSKDCSLALELDRKASSDISPPYKSFSSMESSQSREVEDVILTF